MKLKWKGRILFFSLFLIIGNSAYATTVTLGEFANLIDRDDVVYRGDGTWTSNVGLMNPVKLYELNAQHDFDSDDVEFLNLAFSMTFADGRILEEFGKTLYFDAHGQLAYIGSERHKQMFSGKVLTLSDHLLEVSGDALVPLSVAQCERIHIRLEILAGGSLRHTQECWIATQLKDRADGTVKPYPRFP